MQVSFVDVDQTFKTVFFSDYVQNKIDTRDSSKASIEAKKQKSVKKVTKKVI